MTTCGCKYILVGVTDIAITIRDIGHNCISVTNDAENVVADLTRNGQLGTRRLYYYDSNGRLDELLHDGIGRFLGFAPGRSSPEVVETIYHDFDHRAEL